MEILKLVEYTIDGHENIQDFAMGILALTNIKSTYKETIYDIKTYNGTNIVRVRTYEEMDSELKAHMGTIREKEDFILVNIEYTDIKISEDDITEKIKNKYPNLSEYYNVNCVFEIDEIE